MRQLRQAVREILAAEDFSSRQRELLRIPGRQVVNPLFSFFYDRCETIRWHAVTAMGAVVDRLAREEMESARVVMRRLMWNLNDESGGIGWGSPEAMGDILARNEALAREFGRILVSYLDPEANFLEHPDLQRGLLWGVGRLAGARPETAAGAAAFLAPFLKDEDAGRRGLAARAARAIGGPGLEGLLGRLLHDDAKVRIYIEPNLIKTTVGALAAGSVPDQDRG
jgi:hypothetical protein